jgi:4-hydroxy-2-oxoheptanedioate aldolase
MTLNEKFRSGKEILGTWGLLPSPEMVHVMITAGLDFVIIDMEHGPADILTAHRMVMAAEAAGGTALIRVGSNDEDVILKALDTGVSGILVPHIASKAEATKAVEWMMFPPEGGRGYSPFTKAGAYHYQAGFVVGANKTILKGIIVEGKEGLENLDAILTVESLNLIYVGTYDISSTLGIAGQTGHPEVLKVLEASAAKILKAGKMVGGLFRNDEELAYFKRLGIKFLTYQTDTGVLFETFKRASDNVKGK